MRVRPCPVRTGSVSQDWRTPLPPEKSVTYLHTLRQLETSYAMFSINLDEAIGLRRAAHLPKAYQILSLTPVLCNMLSAPLIVVLRAMHTHAKHFRLTPNLSPLDPDNFQHSKSRRAASLNSICSRLFLTQRSQFLHKISTLLELVEDLDKAFTSSVAELNDPSCYLPEREWDLLDATHYDLNTCLRESIVLLKCFLHTLPDEQLLEFRAALLPHSERSTAGVLLPKRHLAHRRMALLKGQ